MELYCLDRYVEGLSGTQLPPGVLPLANGSGATAPSAAFSTPGSPARTVLQVTHPDAARQRESRLPGHAVASPALITPAKPAALGLNIPRPGNSRLGRDPGSGAAPPPAVRDDVGDVTEFLRRYEVGLLSSYVQQR